MENKKLKVYLKLFQELAAQSNNALIECYKLENFFSATARAYKDKKILKEGKIKLRGDSIEYNFHGTDCSYVFNGIKVNITFNFKDESSSYSFTPYDFKCFVESFNMVSVSEEDISESLVENGLKSNEGLFTV